MVYMANINPTAAAARETARTTIGQFGAQEHSAPELTLSDPKQKAVDDILAARFGKVVESGLAAGDGLDLDDVRALMLEAIDAHQAANPAVVVIDGEGKANDAANVEVIDLDYLGEWYDDGNSAGFHIERATEDLDKIRAAGLENESPSYQLREYIGSELDAEWWDSDEEVIEGVYGAYAVVSPLTGANEFTVREAGSGDIVSTHPTFAEAKSAAESA